MSEHILNHLSGIDRNLGGLIKAVGPYGIVLENDTQPFEALAQAIAHQQLHAAAARNILGRFITQVGGGTFPTPQVVIDAPEQALRAVGFSGSKIAALRDLAVKTVEGVVPDRATLERLEDAEIITRLTGVRGIGRWTVEMLLMFHLGRPDILPVDDFGVRLGFQLTNGLRKMPAPKVLALYGERWGPHRSAAAWYFWRACELKKAGKLPDPVEQIRLPRVLKSRRRRAATAQAKPREANLGRASASQKRRQAKSASAARTTRKTGAAKTQSRARTAAATKAKSRAATRKAAPAPACK